MSSSSTVNLPPHIRSTVESELESGERTVWVDQPIPRRMARKMLPAMLFAIPWTAFAVFWTVMAANGTAHAKGGGPVSNFFPLFGLPFILIGLGMLSSPYWAARAARRSAYVLTDRRAILFNAGLFKSVTVRSFGPQQLHQLQRKQHADGSGDLVLHSETTTDNKGRQQIKEVGFLGVADVKLVEDLVKALAERDAKTP